MDVISSINSFSSKRAEKTHSSLKEKVTNDFTTHKLHPTPPTHDLNINYTMPVGLTVVIVDSKSPFSLLF